jgi:hypothetical protein
MTPAARHVPAALFAALALLALGACGSGGDTTETTTTTAAAPAQGRYTVAQVEKLTGLKRNGDGTWTSVTGCRVTEILPTHAAILKVRTSPDALVVSNGADDVGVVFDGKAGCREALLANLSQVK